MGVESIIYILLKLIICIQNWIIQFKLLSPQLCYILEQHNAISVTVNYSDRQEKHGRWSLNIKVGEKNVTVHPIQANGNSE
jgi:hypothetical protein